MAQEGRWIRWEWNIHIRISGYLENHGVAVLQFYGHEERRRKCNMQIPTSPRWNMWPTFVGKCFFGGTCNNLENEHELSDLSSHIRACLRQSLVPRPRIASRYLRSIVLFFPHQASPSKQLGPLIRTIVTHCQNHGYVVLHTGPTNLVWLQFKISFIWLDLFEGIYNRTNAYPVNTQL